MIASKKVSRILFKLFSLFITSYQVANNIMKWNNVQEELKNVEDVVPSLPSEPSRSVIKQTAIYHTLGFRVLRSHAHFLWVTFSDTPRSYTFRSCRKIGHPSGRGYGFARIWRHDKTGLHALQSPI